MKRLLLCLTALVALTGCGSAAAQREPSPVAASMSSSGQRVPDASTAVTRPAVRPAVPTRLHLGGIDAPVVPVTLAGSTLTPPNDPRVLGWWGKPVGARHGTTLLTGHTVHDGGGTFDDLELTPSGARAHLNGHTYQVTSVRVISKENLAHRATALFAQTGPPKLVLVTCENYDPATGLYASNVVVTLAPLA